MWSGCELEENKVERGRASAWLTQPKISHWHLISLDKMKPMWSRNDETTFFFELVVCASARTSTTCSKRRSETRKNSRVQLQRAQPQLCVLAAKLASSCYGTKEGVLWVLSCSLKHCCRFWVKHYSIHLKVTRTTASEEFPRIRSQRMAVHAFADHFRTPERQFIWDCCRLMDLRSLGNRSDVNQSRVHGPLSPHICKYISTLSKWQEIGRLILLILHSATAKS